MLNEVLLAMEVNAIRCNGCILILYGSHAL
jgi:hypothetical protein